MVGFGLENRGILAFRLGQDPCAFRKANVADPRWEGVLDAVCKASGWTPRPARSQARPMTVRTASGVSCR